MGFCFCFFNSGHIIQSALFVDNYLSIIVLINGNEIIDTISVLKSLKV
jgi:hypothetical protein